MMVRDQINNERNKRQHANVVEDEEPSKKKERNNNSYDKYSLISALTGMVTHEDKDFEVRY